VITGKPLKIGEPQLLSSVKWVDLKPRDDIRIKMTPKGFSSVSDLADLQIAFAFSPCLFWTQVLHAILLTDLLAT
jgi:hypothetical protein